MKAEFPPVNSGGLIEAERVKARFRISAGWFPPVNSGGLIEATLPRKRPTWQPVSAGEFRRPH